MRRLLTQGWTDAIRAVHPEGTVYTFWDYRRMRWERDGGMRLDHFLLSPEVAGRLQGRRGRPRGAGAGERQRPCAGLDRDRGGAAAALNRPFRAAPPAGVFRPRDGGDALSGRLSSPHFLNQSLLLVAPNRRGRGAHSDRRGRHGSGRDRARGAEPDPGAEGAGRRRWRCWRMPSGGRGSAPIGEAGVAVFGPGEAAAAAGWQADIVHIHRTGYANARETALLRGAEGAGGEGGGDQRLRALRRERGRGAHRRPLPA